MSELAAPRRCPGLRPSRSQVFVSKAPAVALPGLPRPSETKAAVRSSRSTRTERSHGDRPPQGAVAQGQPRCSGQSGMVVTWSSYSAGVPLPDRLESRAGRYVPMSATRSMAASCIPAQGADWVYTRRMAGGEIGGEQRHASQARRHSDVGDKVRRADTKHQ